MAGFSPTLGNVAYAPSQTFQAPPSRMPGPPPVNTGAYEPTMPIDIAGSVNKAVGGALQAKDLINKQREEKAAADFQALLDTKYEGMQMAEQEARQMGISEQELPSAALYSKTEDTMVAWYQRLDQVMKQREKKTRQKELGGMLSDTGKTFEEKVGAYAEDGAIAGKDALELVKPSTGKSSEDSIYDSKTGTYIVDKATGKGRPVLGPDGKQLEPIPREAAPIKWERVVTNKGIMELNPVTGEVRDPNLKPEPKISAKSRDNIKAKITTLTLAKKQVADVKEAFKAIKGTLSAGPLQGKTPTVKGKQFDKSVDMMRSTIRALTRTPGEGAMSDYESRLVEAANPKRTDYEDVTEQTIQALEDLVILVESGYTDMLQDSEPETPGKGGTKPPAGPRQGKTKSGKTFTIEVSEE